MTTLRTRISRLLMALALPALLAGCGGSGGGGSSVAPVITAQPTDQTLSATGTTAFGVETQDRNGTSYQWQQSGDGASWTDITTDGNGSSLQIPVGTAKGSGWNKFRCVLTNTAGRTVSDSATLWLLIHVKSSPVPSPDGTSWAKAYTLLQDALSSSMPFSEIWVAAGTYVPGNSSSASFALREDVAVYGGFAGSETARGARDTAANLTTLSGQFSGGNCAHVVLGANRAVLDGFTVTAGNNPAPGDTSGGGGMYNYFCSPIVANCTFTANVGSSGGGMLNSGASPVVRNCIFSGNSATYGGGLSNFNSHASVSQCSFSGNFASWSGGGMSSWNSTVTVLGSVFNGNAADCGGAMYSGESTTTLANCVMAGNTARDGGGLYAVGNGTTAVNCTLVGNTASNLGGGIYAQAVQVTNGILWGNSAGSGSPQLYLFVGSPAPAYSCIQGGSTDNGNIASDPLLNGDHTLNTASPCIDKGNSSAVPADVTTDLAGQARIVGSCVDMGAYEYQ